MKLSLFMNLLKKQRQGFTLIELSIVLVIIGLIVGGVLVGQDLINASAIRAQITQIEKLQTATNTFKAKYGQLPGDIREPDATNFGFVARGIYRGEGDGSGIIEAIFFHGTNGYNGTSLVSGEQGLYWRDLSTARLIDGSFTTADAVTPRVISGTQIAQYLPYSKINSASAVYAHSALGNNYFGIATITSIVTTGPAAQGMSLTVGQAWAIDKKMDDGIPGTGTAFAASLYATGFGWFWAESTVSDTLATTAKAGSATSCYDNANSAGVTYQYSLAQNSGRGMNCVLSFKFQ